jgi:hypothetical protein
MAVKSVSMGVVAPASERCRFSSGCIKVEEGEPGGNGRLRSDMPACSACSA